MAQKKKNTKQDPKKTKKRMPMNQRIMIVVGVFIILSFLLPSLMYFFE